MSKQKNTKKQLDIKESWRDSFFWEKGESALVQLGALCVGGGIFYWIGDAAGYSVSKTHFFNMLFFSILGFVLNVVLLVGVHYWQKKEVFWKKPILSALYIIAFFIAGLVARLVAPWGREVLQATFSGFFTTDAVFLTVWTALSFPFALKSPVKLVRILWLLLFFGVVILEYHLEALYRPHPFLMTVCGGVGVLAVHSLVRWVNFRKDTYDMCNSFLKSVLYVNVAMGASEMGVWSGFVLMMAFLGTAAYIALRKKDKKDFFINVLFLGLAVFLLLLQLQGLKSGWIVIWIGILLIATGILLPVFLKNFSHKRRVP